MISLQNRPTKKRSSAVQKIAYAQRVCTMSLEVAATEVSPARPSIRWPPWVVTVAVGIVFFLAARLSLALLDKADGVAVFWPAAGVASGILVALGPSVRWPVVIGVAAATFAANLLGDRNLVSTTFFAVANAGGPLIVAGLIQRFLAHHLN